MQQPKLLENSGTKWLDFSWPVLAICAFLCGLAIAAQAKPGSFEKGVDAVRKAFVASKPLPAPTDSVIIAAADPARQLQVAATLSPRGFQPLLAKDTTAVKQQLASHASTLSMAVVDQALPGASEIVRMLERSLPASRIVVLETGTRNERIGPMLLERL